MRFAGIILLMILLSLGVFEERHASSQIPRRIGSARPVTCYYLAENRLLRVAPPRRFLEMHRAAAGRVKTSSFQVEYINFPADNLAKNAFEYAIAIWESTLISSEPIMVRAEWKDLGTGVLGQALWGSAYSNFGGEQHQNTFYPVALAEKIARRGLNRPDEPDIVASFNKNVKWYTGIDGNTPNGQMDLVTIVLHEIAHGLGFTDSYDVEGQQGTVGLSSDGGVLPFVFDLFVEDQEGKNLLHHFESPSQAMASALQSKDVFFDGPLSTETLAGVRPELFAPTTFDNGSSVSHLDEATFNGPLDGNRLMTPQIAFAESIHNPGNVLLAMLGDIGWNYTHIDHQPLRDTERMDGAPYKATVNVQSDTGYEPSEVKLHYTTDGVNFATVPMSATGTPDEFVYSFPGKTGLAAYGYFISVADIDGRVFTLPGKIQARGVPPEQGTFFFKIGPDHDAPDIAHKPVTFIPQGKLALVLSAGVTDNIGVEEVRVEFSFHEGHLQSHLMNETVAGHYEVNLELPALQTGDQLQYRIVARDISSGANVAQLPLEGFFNVSVTGVLPVQNSYANNFNTATSDFFGDHFSIAIPEGFADGAIHSDHPYRDGSGDNDESHYAYQLQIPVRIDQTNPVIQFDEIVLIEPGEEGSVFGSEGFFDYVIVEGSTDGGESWEPFVPGYDSREQSVWLSRYNTHVSDFNSQATGAPELYRKRNINMLSNGAFHPGDEVLIRFRLFADQLAHGWGWAIDNLYIQGPVTEAEQPAAAGFAVYPVPVEDKLFIAMKTGEAAVHLEIADVQGRIVFSRSLLESQPADVLSVNAESFAPGLYVVRIRIGKSVYVRKFLKSP